jgi:O-antigen/teichoic acid export membrane protein
MLLYKLFDRGLGLISTVVLARLLVPEDFGIVAMAMSVIALLELLGAFNLDAALIQHRDTSEDHFHAAWTMNFLCASLVALLLLSVAWPLSIFYREPRLTAVMVALAAGTVIQGLENIGTVSFRKDLDFVREFRFLAVKRVLPFLVTIPLAFYLRNYWALVAGVLVGRIGGVAVSYVLHPFRPRPSFRRLMDLMHFSKWMLVHNLIAFLKDKSSSFVIGRLSGIDSVGLFSVSAEIASLPSTELIAPINRALLPVYAKLARDPPALAREYLSAMGIIALIGVPAVAGVAVTAPYIIFLFLGNKWFDAIPLLQILAFFGITQVLQTNAFSAFLALGRTKPFVQINAIHVVVLLTALVTLTGLFGLVGAAWAYVIAALLLLPVNLALIKSYLNLGTAEYLNRLWRPIVAATVMYASVRLFGPRMTLELAAVPEVAWSLAQCVSIGFVSYILADLALWFLSGRPEGAETSILNLVRASAERIRAAARDSRV